MAMTLEQEREAFEKWYVEHAFDYEKNPIWSREFCIAWDAWQARAHLPQPAQAVDVGAISLDGTDNEVLSEFIRLCREAKPVGRWPGERVCVAIERFMANQKPFRFIAESDKSPERGHNGRGGDGDRVFSGPQPTIRALSAEKARWRVPDGFAVALLNATDAYERTRNQFHGKSRKIHAEQVSLLRRVFAELLPASTTPGKEGRAMKDDSPEHHTHMLMGRMVLNNVIVPPAPENPMNAGLREAVERASKWLLKPPAALRSMYRGNARKSYADEARELAEPLEAVAQAMRDQEAEIARLQAIVNRLRQAITAHLGGEQ